MLKIAICDDEKRFRTDLQRVLEQELDLNGYEFGIEEYASGEELIRELSKKSYDICFLDIEMRKLNGVETAKELRKRDKSAEIIFVTSHPDFVFQGYEVQALHYILKPYQKEKILEVLHLALERCKKGQEQTFYVEQRGISVKLMLDKILYFYSDRHCVAAVTADEERSFSGKLDETQKGLPGGFQRIHNRYLVNMKHIENLSASQVTLSNGIQLPVSRSLKQELAINYARYMLG